MTAAAIRDIPGITSPITHAGRVVYNGIRNFLETRRRMHMRGLMRVYEDEAVDKNPENFSIQPYELCFRWNESLNKIHTPNDTDMAVFSSANGIGLSAHTYGHLVHKSNTDREAQMIKNLHFAGVACNRALYDPSNHANEEGLAVQVGGLQTIYNTGEGQIFAGDLVMWDKPVANKKTSMSHGHRPRIPGIRHEKLLFGVKRWDFATPANFDFEASQRIIGKAMSTAKSGQPFDILLGRYCV